MTGFTQLLCLCFFQMVTAPLVIVERSIDMSKIGLIVEGGGMKCAYSAGVLDKFLDDSVSFDYAIGVSAGSANLCSYLAGQRERNLRYYTEHLKKPGYFGLKSFLTTGNIFGLDFIYGTLSNSNGADPIDYPALASDPTEFTIVATDARTGKPHYFSKDELKQDDYSVIKASCALPGICRPVEVNGQYYFDGGVTDAIPVQHALDNGCDKLVIILSKNRNFIKQPEKHRLLYSFLCRKYPETIQAIDRRHLMYQKCQSLAYELERQKKAFIFAPSESISMSTYSMDIAVEHTLYELGIRDYQSHSEQFCQFLRE